MNMRLAGSLVDATAVEFLKSCARVRRDPKAGLDMDTLWEVVRNAARQTHGTMIIISSAAAEEVDRLEEQSTVLKDPVPLSEANLLMLSSIDGAVLIDPAGVCHAAGVR